MKVSASWDPVLIVVGRGAVRGVTCVLVLVLALVHVWNHSILYEKTIGLREHSREGNARHCRHRSERNTLLCVCPNIIVASHIVDIWHRHAITLVQNARVRRRRIPLRGGSGTVHRKCSLEKSVVMLETKVVHLYTKGRSPLGCNADG
jgi:hypothetical protein